MKDEDEAHVDCVETRSNRARAKRFKGVDRLILVVDPPSVDPQRKEIISLQKSKPMPAPSRSRTRTPSPTHSQSKRSQQPQSKRPQQPQSKRRPGEAEDAIAALLSISNTAAVEVVADERKANEEGSSQRGVRRKRSRETNVANQQKRPKRPKAIDTQSAENSISSSDSSSRQSSSSRGASESKVNEAAGGPRPSTNSNSKQIDSLRVYNRCSRHVGIAFFIFQRQREARKRTNPNTVTTPQDPTVGARRLVEQGKRGGGGAGAENRLHSSSSPTMSWPAQQHLLQQQFMQRHVPPLVQGHSASLMQGHSASLMQGHSASLMQGHSASLMQGHSASLMQGRSASLMQGQPSPLLQSHGAPLIPGRSPRPDSQAFNLMQHQQQMLLRNQHQMLLQQQLQQNLMMPPNGMVDHAAAAALMQRSFGGRPYPPMPITNENTPASVRNHLQPGGANFQSHAPVKMNGGGGVLSGPVRALA
eukprot:397628_1